MSGSTNRIAFLSFVRERVRHEGLKGMNITKISITERGGIRNVK